MQSSSPQAMAPAHHVSFPPHNSLTGVRTAVSYTVPPTHNDEIYHNLAAAEGETRSNYTSEEVEVFVTDMRQSQEAFQLHKNGFELHELVVPEDLDWSDQGEVGLQ